MAPRVLPLLKISILGILVLILRFTVLRESAYKLELRTPIVSIRLSLDRWQFFTFRIEHPDPINRAKIHFYGIKVGLLRLHVEVTHFTRENLGGQSITALSTAAITLN
ncbi:hypothetical protein H4I96_02689 [Botrytis cinerea]